MLNIQISSISVPYEQPALLENLLALVSKVAAMGLLVGKPIQTLDASTLRTVFDALQRDGLMSVQRSRLQPILDAGASEKPAADVLLALRNTVEALDESPVPDKEWVTMREIFGDDALADLIGISDSSLKRYAGGERSTPLDVADRLHWLAMVVADLAGSYNEYGIRRWFERPRAQLEGKSPRAFLGKRWDSSAPAAQRVRELAHGLFASGAT